MSKHDKAELRIVAGVRVEGFDAARVEETSVCSLCDAYETNLCRQNGQFYLHTRKMMGPSIVTARQVGSSCKPISEVDGRLLIAIHGSSRGRIGRKVAELDHEDGLVQAAVGISGEMGTGNELA